MEAIIMLTKNDQTIADAFNVFRKIAGTGIKNIGFKDVGLEKSQLKHLYNLAKEKEMTVFFEVVSLDEEAEQKAVETGLEIGADYIIGGINSHKVLPMLSDRLETYFPYVGHVVDRPCKLRGEVEEIVQNAIELQEQGVGGINVLAYRYDKDIQDLIERLREEIEKPILVAGSVNNEERILFLKNEGVNFITVGTSIIDRHFVEDGTLADQVDYVLNAVRNKN